MGKRGPVAKTPERAQGHRSRDLIVLPSRRLERDGAPPSPPKGFLAPTRRAWVAYWNSDVAPIAGETAMPAIRRLFTYYDQHERAIRVLVQRMTVKGSMGQERVNPLADYALKLEAAIGRLENELGLTPSARARLGIEVGNAVRSLEDLTRSVTYDIDLDDEDQAPRPGARDSEA